MEAYGDHGVTAQLVLNPGTRTTRYIRYTPKGVYLDIRWIRGWLDPRAGLEALSSPRFVSTAY
jgi:hypothetical protein